MDPVTQRWMPRFTPEHQRAEEKFDTISKQMQDTEGAREQAWAAARDARKDAQNLEAQFKAKVDEMERTGRPDPDPEKTRALAQQMDKAAEVSAKADQAESDAEAAHQRVMIQWRAAEGELRDAGQNDPAWQDYTKELEEEKAQSGSSQTDPSTPADAASAAAASQTPNTAAEDTAATADAQAVAAGDDHSADATAQMNPNDPDDFDHATATAPTAGADPNVTASDFTNQASGETAQASLLSDQSSDSSSADLGLAAGTTDDGAPAASSFDTAASDDSVGQPDLSGVDDSASYTDPTYDSGQAYDDSSSTQDSSGDGGYDDGGSGDATYSDSGSADASSGADTQDLEADPIS